MRRILFVDDEPSVLQALHRMLRNIRGPAVAIDTDYLKRIGCADRLDSWRQICRMANLEGIIS